MDQGDRGMMYQLRYMGCISINASMRKLDFTVRSVLAKECITRVCESANMISSKKRKVDKLVQKSLPGPPNMESSGENVYLSISTRHIVVTLLHCPQILFEHPLHDISFAASGDQEQETQDFVCYVGKDEKNGRRCYVFECAVGKAQDVISTIGKAFNTRFDQVTSTPVTTINARGAQQPQLPAATSPKGTPTVTIGPQRPATTSPKGTPAVTVGPQHNPAPVPEPPPRVTLASSPRSPVLIDLNSSPTRPAAHAYVNTSEDFFDGPSSTVQQLPCMKNLKDEPWFHGRLSREESETLIRRDGEFIVRMSAKDPDQAVLTGMQNGIFKHLMLIDDEGKVRTKDREFESVTHLIQHHQTTGLPITSSESALLLRYPVPKNG